MKSELSLPAIPITFWSQLSSFSCCLKRVFIQFLNIKIRMASKVSVVSIDSDVFSAEQLLSEPRPQRNNSPNILNLMELSGFHRKEMPTISSVASPEPGIVNLDDNCNDPNFPYGFGAQQPIVPPSLNNLNLPPNPFIILAAMTVVRQNPTQHDDNYSPQSLEPSGLSPISTPPMNVSTIDGWETQLMDDNTFYSEDEPRRVYRTYPLDETLHSECEPRRNYLLSGPSPPPPPRKMKRNLEKGMSFPKRWRVSQRVCEACGQVNPPIKDIPGPSTED